MPAPRRGANSSANTPRTTSQYDMAIDNSDPSWNTSLAKLPPFLAALKSEEERLALQSSQRLTLARYPRVRRGLQAQKDCSKLATPSTRHHKPSRTIHVREPVGPHTFRSGAGVGGSCAHRTRRSFNVRAPTRTGSKRPPTLRERRRRSCSLNTASIRSP